MELDARARLFDEEWMRVPLVLLALTVFVLITALERPVDAQVNIEPLRHQIEEQGKGGRVAVSLSALRGNVDKLALSGSGLAGVRVHGHLVLLNATGDYTQFNQQRVVEKAFAHLRYNAQIESWLWWELFAQAERDAFRSIRDRELMGTGPRVGWRGKAHGLFLGTAWMLENTRRDRPLPGESGGQYLVNRWSSYLSARDRLGEQISFGATLYLQPRFADFDDYRALVAVGLEFEVTDVIRTGVETSVRYESRVPAGVARADGAFNNYLAATF
jgi:hypothetical protein